MISSARRAPARSRGQTTTGRSGRRGASEGSHWTQTPPDGLPPHRTFAQVSGLPTRVPRTPADSSSVLGVRGRGSKSVVPTVFRTIVLQNWAQKRCAHRGCCLRGRLPAPPRWRRRYRPGSTRSATLRSMSSASQRLTVLLVTSSCSLASRFTIIVMVTPRPPRRLMNSRILWRAIVTSATVPAPRAEGCLVAGVSCSGAWLR